jgi:Holliday junction resolvasome RuvABC endonuclease subunit
MAIVTGLDPSLTSFGFARIEDGAAAVTGRATPRTRGHERLDYLLSTVAEWAAPADLCLLEGPAYAAKGSSVIDLGGLHWLVRHHLWSLGVPYAVVPPALRAKYITGKGNAPKDQVLAAAIRRYPQVMLDGNDEADALVLAAMGADHLGQPLAAVPQAWRAVLTQVAQSGKRRGKPAIIWPELDQVQVPAGMLL